MTWRHGGPSFPASVIDPASEMRTATASSGKKAMLIPSYECNIFRRCNFECTWPFRTILIIETEALGPACGGCHGLRPDWFPLGLPNQSELDLGFRTEGKWSDCRDLQERRRRCIHEVQVPTRKDLLARTCLVYRGFLKCIPKESIVNV